MRLETVHCLFTLFSGEEDSHAFAPLISSAVQEVTQQLRSDADSSDVRLCYLAAAIANVRYAQITSSKNYPLATFAGNVARASDGEQRFSFAERLVKDYQWLCGDLLKNRDFAFLSVGGGSCE
ncbi:MAG TPA: hypothetical protein DCO72_02650 [Ruminococcus sp.]|nr:hypothetical protein [Ruminococcus sp.]